MTIKDIARLANVSASTVSKIINGKDGNISPETCERVRKIVKEYNYSPYTNAIAANKSKTFMVGLLLHGGMGSGAMVAAFLRQARADGYGAMVCVNNDAADELKNVSMLLTHRVDGVLWQQARPGSASAEGQFQKRGVPFYTINAGAAPSKRNLCMDFESAGHTATKALTATRHRAIACIHPPGGQDTEVFHQGYLACLRENNIPVNDSWHLIWGEDNAGAEQLLLTCTAFVCYNVAIASELIHRAERKGYVIPRDLSVVSLDHGEGGYRSGLSTLALPYAEFGSHCARTLVAALEDKREGSFSAAMKVEGGTVDVPFSVRGKKVVVVGALNVDTIINVGHFSSPSETLAAKSYAIMPGGRGVNQAIGAAKLGADVYLIGRRGADYDGNAIIDTLLEARVDVTGVKTDPKAATGRGYIHIQETGDSSIVVYEGANNNLTPADIDDAADILEGADYCLLQTDTRMDTVLHAAKTARAHGARVILKPSFLDDIQPSIELLQYVDILLPNQAELNKLCPVAGSLEDKARYFREKGVGTVIVTLGEQGCYRQDDEHSDYTPGAGFTPVDTTGAADAFAAALAVYLAGDKGMAQALRYANYAAGYSTTHQGVPPSLADKRTLEALIPSDESS